MAGGIYQNKPQGQIELLLIDYYGQHTPPKLIKKKGKPDGFQVEYKWFNRGYKEDHPLTNDKDMFQNKTLGFAQLQSCYHLLKPGHMYLIRGMYYTSQRFVWQKAFTGYYKDQLAAFETIKQDKNDRLGFSKTDERYRIPSVHPSLTCQDVDLLLVEHFNLVDTTGEFVSTQQSAANLHKAVKNLNVVTEQHLKNFGIDF